MANNRELSQFGSLVEVTNEASSIKVGLADANVGLGTTSPTERLEVHGNIKVVGGSINVGSSGTFTNETQFNAGVGIADSIFHIGDVNTQLRFPAADTFTIETAGSERVRVSAAGSVGIGTNSPTPQPGFTKVLHVYDDSPQVLLERETGSGDVKAGFNVWSGNASLETFTATPLRIRTSGNTNQLALNTNGYIGIGTNVVSELLHVGSAQTTSPAIRVQHKDGSIVVGRRSQASFGVGVTANIIESDGDTFAVGTSDGEDFVIGTNDERRITVKSNGRVGIGTDDPDELFEVFGLAQAANLKVTGIGTFQNVRVSGNLTVDGTTTTLDTTLIDVDRIEVGANSDSIVAVAVTQSGKADILKFFNNDGTEVLGVSTGGNVTIQNTDTGSSAAPELTLIRDNGVAGDDADYLGQIKFTGINTTGGQKNYAKITGKILDASVGTEDGIIEFAHIKAGSQTITGRWRSDSLQLLNGTAFSVAGDITANGNIQGDGSTNITSINDITAGGDLTIDGVSDLDELTVAGVSTFSANLDVNASVDVSTNLTVDGVSDLDEVTIAGVSTFSSNLDVNASVDVSTDLTVDGITDLDELKVAGVSTFSSAVRINTTSGARALTVNAPTLGPYVTFEVAGTAKADLGPEGAALGVGSTDRFLVNARGARDIALRTNSVERFTVAGGGNIGIGQTSPNAPLSFASATGQKIELYNSGSNNEFGFGVENSELRISSGTGSIISFRTGGYSGTERVRVTDAGAIVTGITTVNGNVFVRASSDPTIQIENTDSSISADQAIGSIEFKANDGSNAGDQVTGSIESVAQAAFTGQGSPSHLIFKTNGVSGADALAERLRITHDGKIGIGTDNPSKTLTLFGASSSSFRISKSGVLAYDHTFDGSSYTIANNNGSAGIPIIIGTKTAGGESLRIDSSGNIGVGETSPDVRLHVKEQFDTAYSLANVTTETNHLLKLENPSTTANAFAGMHFRVGSGADLFFGAIQQSVNHGDFFFANQNSPNKEIMRIKSSGLVGINSTSPTTSLDIQSTQNSDGLTITKAGTRSAFLGHNGTGNEGLLILREDGTNNVQLYAESGQPSFINSGNLGIGTAVPTWKTTIAGGSAGAATTTLNLHVNTTTSGTGSILRFSNSTDVTSTYGTAEIRGVRASHDTGQTDLIFRTSAGGSVTEKLRIMGDYARIGIGTTNPKSYANSQTTLVIHDTTNPSLCISDSGQTRDWWIVGHGDGLAVKYADGGHDSGVQNVTNLAFFRNNGNFGLNESEPDFPLHLSQGMVANAPYFIHMGQSGNTNAVGGGAGIQFDTSASNTDNTLYLAQISGERSISNDGSNTLVFKTTKATVAGDDGAVHSPKTRMVLTEDGRLGIGVTNPSVVLEATSTDAIKVPVGTTAQRPTGAAGYIRYNSSIASYEGHNGSEWAGIGGAAEVETSVSSTVTTTCESFAKASYRSATIVAQITQGSSYQVGNYLLIHDGTTATLVEESAVATGDMLGTFTGAVSGSNVVFQVNMASSAAATVTTKMTKVSIP